ncbi:MAG TPA: MerR family transcriptional regulator [Pyrinomonadaceae bacterium]|nr:MerR family transcriptional regulator [Pyrinomonadaceae bacterium]
MLTRVTVNSNLVGMSDLLQNLRETEYQGVKELADVAERVLREAGPTYRKGTVAEYPNERTVRYYISSGLLTSASEKRGLRSVFGYEHLLKLLTIKKLQADGLPISVIKELISDKAIEDLERLFDEEIDGLTEDESRPILPQSASGPADTEVHFSISSARKSAAVPPAKSKAREYLESLLMKSKPRAEWESETFSSVSPDALPPRLPDPPDVGWKRYEVVPGLELHARDDFKPADDVGRLMEVLERIFIRLDQK